MAKALFSNLKNKTGSLIKWGVNVSFALSAIVVITLLLMLFMSTGDGSGWSQQFNILLLLNSALAMALFLWVLVLMVRLYRQLRHKQFGSKLTSRLTIRFAIMAIIPGALIYMLSIQYMTRAVESWFNVKVDSALESGLALGQASIGGLQNDLLSRARLMATNLSNVADPDIAVALTNLREVSPSIVDAMVFSTNSGTKIIGFSSSTYGSLLPIPPEGNVINQLRMSRQYSQVEVVPDTHPPTLQMRIRIIVPIFNEQYRYEMRSLNNSEPYWLQLTSMIPYNISNNIYQVKSGFKDYAELASARVRLRELFVISLSLALLLTVLASLAVALSLARRLVSPLLTLAEGTQAVGIGDYRPLPDPKTRDEIAQLTRSFNTMTLQLEEARHQVETNRVQLEKSNVYLESVLASITSGVIAFDEEFNVLSINKGAQNILMKDLSHLTGFRLEKADDLREFASDIHKGFATLKASGSRKTFWQGQIELNLGQAMLESLDTYQTKTLLVRGTRIRVDGQSTGYLVVFDDISEVISANRAVAWGEVARRMAHEIKNPLTPIQLSAERLAFKLSSKLGEQDAKMLERSTNTIVNQVSSLKRMVDDFREYARTPPAQLQSVDLNELLLDLAILYGWDPEHKSQSEPLYRQIKLNLDESIPLIEADASQLRQVFNNLLSNSREAMEGLTLEGDEPGVTIETSLVEAYSGNAPAVSIIIEDRGTGFAPEIIQSIFEPYVTTKSNGTGLGLAIVRKIIEEHHGNIEVSNRPEGGARISILLTLLSKHPKSNGDCYNQ